MATLITFDAKTKPPQTTLHDVVKQALIVENIGGSPSA